MKTELRNQKLISKNCHTQVIIVFILNSFILTPKSFSHTELFSNQNITLQNEATDLSQNHPLLVQANNPNGVVVSADGLSKDDGIKLSGTFVLSKSTSLYDYQDGTRSDSTSLLVLPFLKTPVGNFSSLVSYSYNDRDPEDTATNGASDLLINYSRKPIDWAWTAPKVVTLTPFLGVILPTSKASRVRDNLRFNLNTGLNFGLKPDGLGLKGPGDLIFGVTVNFGRNFHDFEENINGDVLNKYTSNQIVNLGYSYQDFYATVTYIHRSRWTYQNGVRDSFILIEELGYNITPKYGVAIGHTNFGNGLKTNGFESNFDVVDDNNSAVYFSLFASL